MCTPPVWYTHKVLCHPNVWYRLSWLRFAWLVMLVACADPSQLEIHVGYDPAWGLEHLVFSARDKSSSVEPAPVVTIDVPEAWVAQDIELTVLGLVGGTPYASGKVHVAPARGGVVVVELALTPNGCDAWCSEGSRRCVGNSIVSCVRDSQGCLRWNEPTACPQACNSGACAEACADECAPGETMCLGTGGVTLCGNFDDDPCQEWQPTATPCAAGHACSAGACRDTCVSECEAGARACRNGGVVRCEDRNGNGCLAWGPAVSCEAGQTCSEGSCASTCRDECAVARCDGSVRQACGQFDDDACTEYSTGTRCETTDPCQVGVCTLTGCTTMPKPCDPPPVPTCVNPSTRRVFSGTGTCEAGVCRYAQRDEACPGGCANGACVATTCTCEQRRLTPRSLSWVEVGGDYVYVREGSDAVFQLSKRDGTQVRELSGVESFEAHAGGVYVLTAAKQLEEFVDNERVVYGVVAEPGQLRLGQRDVFVMHKRAITMFDRQTRVKRMVQSDKPIVDLVADESYYVLKKHVVSSTEFTVTVETAHGDVLFTSPSELLFAGVDANHLYVYQPFGFLVSAKLLRIAKRLPASSEVLGRAYFDTAQFAGGRIYWNEARNDNLLQSSAVDRWQVTPYTIKAHSFAVDASGIYYITPGNELWFASLCCTQPN